MEERGFFCFMAPVYLLAPNMLLTFLIINPMVNFIAGLFFENDNEK